MLEVNLTIRLVIVFDERKQIANERKQIAEVYVEKK